MDNLVGYEEMQILPYYVFAIICGFTGTLLVTSKIMTVRMHEGMKFHSCIQPILTGNPPKQLVL